MAVLHSRPPPQQQHCDDDDSSGVELSASGGLLAKRLIREYVSDALHQRCQAIDTGAYIHLVREIRRLREQLAIPVVPGDAVAQADAAQAAVEMANLLLGVAGSVSLLNDKLHASLLTQLLDMPLWSLPSVVRVAALEVLLQLCHGHLVGLGVGALVAAVVPPPAPPAPPPATGAAWQPDRQSVQVQDQVLATLMKVLALVPTAPSRALPLVVGRLPHKSRDTDAHCLALRAAFAVALSPAGATIRDELLAAVVDKLLELDVDIAWQHISERPEEEADEEHDQQAQIEAEVEDMFALEGVTDLELNGNHHSGRQHRGGWEGPAAPALVPAAERTVADEQAAKLDAMMELTLSHLEARVQGGTAAAAWATLLEALERALLPTQRSKFTQFLLFYLARQEADKWCGELLRLLLQRLDQPTAAPLTRSAAAAYAGSFLARAAFVPQSHLAEAIQGMAQWCLRYCTSQGGPVAGGGRHVAHLQARSAVAPAAALPSAALAAHQVFYSAFQALLYAMCYHLEGIMQPQPQLPSSADTQLSPAAQAITRLFQAVMPPLLSHWLDPLAACNQSVASEFTRLAGRLRLLPRHHLQPPALATPSRRPLEMFFPFDPYLLPRSARFLKLQETYVVWRRGHARSGASGTAAMRGAVAAGASDDGASSEEEDEDGDSASEGPSSEDDSDDDEDEPRSLPTVGMHRPPQRSQSAAFQPIRGLTAARRTASAGAVHGGLAAVGHSFDDPFASSPTSSGHTQGVAIAGVPLGYGTSIGGSSGPIGSASTQGGDAALGVSPWGRAIYGASPGGVTGMSWAPEITLNGFKRP